MALPVDALTTVSALETELGITPDSETTRLERLISVASKRVVGALGRSQIHHEVDREEFVKSFGSFVLRLELTPIVSVDSVEYSIDGGTTRQLIDANGYTIGVGHSYGQLERLGGTWRSTGIKSLPGVERPFYIVTYTGGWITPQQEVDGVGARTLPHDIEDAVLLLAARRYMSGATGEAVKSERLMKASITYANVGVGSSGLPQDIEALLEPYVRCAI